MLKGANKHKKGVSRMAKVKVNKMERNLAAGERIREASKRIWEERRKKNQDAQFAWTIANWVPSEEKARGINKVIEAKKKELPPIQFAKNWNGELQRLGFKAIWRHTKRYGIAFSLEDTRDAIAEAVASLWEEGKLQASLEHDALSLSREDKIQFCWTVVNAYRRYIHPGKKQSEITLEVILGMEEFYQWRPSGPEAELRWIELKESLRQTLSNIDYATCQLLLQGYSKGQAARLLKLDRRTLRRRLDRLPAGKLLKILR
jgi:hypothetical protein